MDWSNENYARLYTRDTDDDLVLSWQARAVWHEMVRKFDRSGVISLKRGRRGLAALLRIPLEVVEEALPELLEDGRIRELEVGYFCPNFMEAQEAPSSDKQRKAESRARRRDLTAALASGVPVTKRDLLLGDGHETGRLVTNRDEMSGDPDHRSLLPDLGSLSRDLAPPSPELPDPRAPVGEISSPPIPPQATAVLHAAATPPLAPVPSGAPRDQQRRRLHAKAWQFAGEEHRKLKAAGVDAHARNCWSGNPAGDDATLLFARIDALTAGDDPDWDAALEVIQNRVLVAVVRARHDLGHLGYFTPARMWDGASFAIDGALSPAQALQLAEAKRAKARAGPQAATEPPTRRFKNL